MKEISALLERHSERFHPLVPFDAEKDRLFVLDLTAANTELSADIVADTDRFSAYINLQLQKHDARYAIGGYGEHRTMYSRSAVFDGPEEPRRLHLGLDIWGEAGTPVFAALDGQVHSFAFNDHFGDYGATIILQHEIEGMIFYSLYGHLAVADLDLHEGQKIGQGQEFAHFGIPRENGWWPPHLHFQLIIDPGQKKGDYPGVCKYSERAQYLANCPDPDLIARLYRYV